MSGTGLPRYPNYRATFGTSLAVVTSLMASISTAIVVVLSVDTASEHGLSFIRWTADQVGIAAGSLAVVLFVGATLGAVYAQAANYDELPVRVLHRMFAGRVDRDARTKEWEVKVDAAYKVTRVCWIYGVSLLFVTLGTLAYGKLPGALPAMAMLAAVVALLNLADQDFRSAFLVITSLVLAAGCAAVAGAAAWAIWS